MFFCTFSCFPAKKKKKNANSYLRATCAVRFFVVLLQRNLQLSGLFRGLLFVRMHEWIATRKLAKVGSQIRYNTFTHK